MRVQRDYGTCPASHCNDHGGVLIRLSLKRNCCKRVVGRHLSAMPLNPQQHSSLRSHSPGFLPAMMEDDSGIRDEPFHPKAECLWWIIFALGIFIAWLRQHWSLKFFLPNPLSSCSPFTGIRLLLFFLYSFQLFTQNKSLACGIPFWHLPFEGPKLTHT